jgi:hypothetical protein
VGVGTMPETIAHHNANLHLRFPTEDAADAFRVLHIDRNPLLRGLKIHTTIARSGRTTVGLFSVPEAMAAELKAAHERLEAQR